jgi:hypothetical protein
MLEGAAKSLLFDVAVARLAPIYRRVIILLGVADKFRRRRDV